MSNALTIETILSQFDADKPVAAVKENSQPENEGEILKIAHVLKEFSPSSEAVESLDKEAADFEKKAEDIVTAWTLAEINYLNEQAKFVKEAKAKGFPEANVEQVLNKHAEQVQGKLHALIQEHLLDKVATEGTLGQKVLGGLKKAVPYAIGGAATGAAGLGGYAYGKREGRRAEQKEILDALQREMLAQAGGGR